MWVYEREQSLQKLVWRKQTAPQSANVTDHMDDWNQVSIKH